MNTTLEDIAKVADVSVTTVSNALRGKGRVSDKMQSRIIQIAEELGYNRKQSIPDTNLIGLISCSFPGKNNDPSFWNSTSYYTHKAIEGINTTIGNRYNLIYKIIKNNNETDLPDMVTDNLIQGLIVIGGSIKDELIIKLNENNIPMVLVFTDIFNQNINNVLADYRFGGYLAANYLIQLNHKNIGFINGWSKTHTSEMKLEGFKKALKENNMSFDSKLYQTGNFTKQDGKTTMEQLLKQNQKPTAVFVADDIMALGAIEKCREIGLKIPEDISMIGFGNSPFSSSTNPPLSTINVPKYHIGEIAAKRLFSIIENENKLNQKIILPVNLIKRNSCKKLE